MLIHTGFWRKGLVISIILILVGGCSVSDCYQSFACGFDGYVVGVGGNDGDIDCWGNLSWTNVTPGEMVYGLFYIRNAGVMGDLYWNISEWPSWGVWDFGSFFPKIPPGGLWIVCVNVTAPDSPHNNFSGEIILSNVENSSDVGVIPASMTTGAREGYTVSERLIGIIGELVVDENVTSFRMVLGCGIRILEYDSGGLVAFVVPYVLTRVRWAGNFTFRGMLKPHFVKGSVWYRVD